VIGEDGPSHQPDEGFMKKLAGLLVAISLAAGLLTGISAVTR